MTQARYRSGDVYEWVKYRGVGWKCLFRKAKDRKASRVETEPKSGGLVEGQERVYARYPVPIADAARPWGTPDRLAAALMPLAFDGTPIAEGAACLVPPAGPPEKPMADPA